MQTAISLLGTPRSFSVSNSRRPKCLWTNWIDLQPIIAMKWETQHWATKTDNKPAAKTLQSSVQKRLKVNLFLDFLRKYTIQLRLDNGINRPFSTSVAAIFVVVVENADYGASLHVIVFIPHRLRFVGPSHADQKSFCMGGEPDLICSGNETWALEIPLVPKLIDLLFETETSHYAQ